MPKLTISVTQEDIKAGIRLHCGLCPVARAARRALRLAEIPHDEQLMHVNAKNIYPMGASKIGSKRHLLPNEAAEFISCFDSGFPVNPFSFEIDIDNS